MMNMYYHRIHLTLVASVDSEISDSRIIIVKVLKRARRRLLSVLSVEYWVLSSSLSGNCLSLWKCEHLIVFCRSMQELVMGISLWKVNDDADVSWPY